MKVKVLKDFITKKGKFIECGEEIELSEGYSEFYKGLLDNKFIKKLEIDFDDWEKRGIKSQLANLIIAPDDYEEGDKSYFTWDEAASIKGKLANGWRLPTRHEWALICEEIGLGEGGALEGEKLIASLALHRYGYIQDGDAFFNDTDGYYWSSTPHSNNTSAYNLNVHRSVCPSNPSSRYLGMSVRLVKELEEK